MSEWVVDGADAMLVADTVDVLLALASEAPDRGARDRLLAAAVRILYGVRAAHPQTGKVTLADMRAALEDRLSRLSEAQSLRLHGAVDADEKAAWEAMMALRPIGPAQALWAFRRIPPAPRWLPDEYWNL